MYWPILKNDVSVGLYFSQRLIEKIIDRFIHNVNKHEFQPQFSLWIDVLTVFKLKTWSVTCQR